MNEQRKRILKMVEEGKLTVDEALILLNELDKSTESMETKQDNLIKELSTFVQFDEKQKEGQKSTGSHSKSYSTKEKFFEFVDMAVKKLKDIDLDLNFGKYIEISHIFQQTDAFVKNIDIDVANGNITLIPWDQKDVRVECQARVYRVDSQEQARINFLKDITFAIEGDCLRFSTGQKWMKLDAAIYIPQTDYEKMKIRMFNGNIESHHLNVRKFKVKTANGKIMMDEIKSSTIEAETANGAITFNNCEAADIDAETINGAIKLNGDFHKVELQSFNGDVECKIFGNNCEWIDAKTTTGGIFLAVPESAAVNGELKSNLGNFKVDVEGIQIIEEKSELIQKNLTFKSVKEALNKIHLIADSKTGTIKISKV